jgi:hypothetical protein
MMLSAFAVMSLYANAQANLWTYDFNDGSAIYSMSDNGEWAVAYGINDATSTYSFPKIIDLTNHTATELITEKEINSGVTCYINDITDDGNIAVGCYNEQPAYWQKEANAWTTLKVKEGETGGRIEAVTPDGLYAVGVCTKVGFDEVATMWDIKNNEIITLKNLPPCDLSGGYQAMMRFTGISADARYLVGCVSYSYPADVLYFLYDRTEQSWTALAFTFDLLKRKFTPLHENLATLDGIYISPNGEWVAGTAYSKDNIRSPYRYQVSTKTFEYFNETDDLDKGCVVVDNNGTLYASTPAINPSRSLYVRHGKYWYGLDEILKQNYDIDYYMQSSYEATGVAAGISTDCKTLVAMAYINKENYQITLPTSFAEACKTVNLLANHKVSIRNGAKIQKLANISLRFTRDVITRLTADKIQLKDSQGNAVRNALKFETDPTSSKTINIGFRTYTLNEGETYTIDIPKGAIGLLNDEEQTSEAITLTYTGLGANPIEATQVSPENGSTMGHLDMNTNPIVIAFNTDVLVKAGAKALVYRNDEAEHFAELNMLHGTTPESYNMVMVYPNTTLNLYKGVNYKIVIPADALTDAAGYSSNAQIEINYIGSFERTVVSDNSNIFIEDFSTGMGGMMLFDADGNVPVAEMQAWNFTENTAWNYAADDDYTNTCAVSHSMYVPSGQSADWMMTPQLFIPDNRCKLTFDAQSYRKSKTDSLHVIIYENAENINELNGNLIQEIEAQGHHVIKAQLTPGNEENVLQGDWQHFSIDLNDYAGKNIYIAFVNKTNNGSAVFVTNIAVSRAVDFEIALIGVPETTVAATSQVIGGAIQIKDTEQTYTSATVALRNDEGATIEEITETNLSLSSGASYNFEFKTPLPLTLGEICKFSIHVVLGKQQSQAEAKFSIKNLAFKPTKRIVLEENTGMGCQNCPLGHQALEYITHAYADQFIPIAYHTYTGDVLESGMTDYVQYFLGLNAAPTAVVNRAISGVSPMVASMVNGNNDYQYSVGDGSTWLDAVSQQLATDTEADIATTATYDESTGNITINYEVTYAITKPTNPAALLCVITEDGLTGYQTNAFSTQTDPDLGEWGKGGIYGKQNVYPFTFNDVARALYPTNAYNGQTGLLPASVDHEQSYQGTITLNVKTDAPYVKDINNLHATCIIIDTETGTYVNASRAKVVNAPASINNHQNTNTTVQAVADGIGIKAPQNTLITLTDALGRTLNQSMISGTQTIKTNHKGLIIVHTSNGHNKQSFKIVR